MRVVDAHGVEGAAVVGAHKGAGPAGQALVGSVGLGKEAVLSFWFVRGTGIGNAQHLLH